MSNNINIELVGSTMVVRFTRPEIRNPLSTPVLDELDEIADACANKNSIRGLIFTGSEDVFASGADLREIHALTPETADSFARGGQALMTKFSSLPQIVIAAINGYCFGGALDLALACRYRIASPTAKFAHPGAGLGIITGWGGTQRLPRLIGRGRALELFFTAEAVDAEKAFVWGLVDHIVPEPLERALELTDFHGGPAPC
jgi:enoyl-CoA hydratase